jgi:hypothetical protein
MCKAKPGPVKIKILENFVVIPDAYNENLECWSVELSRV